MVGYKGVSHGSLGRTEAARRTLDRSRRPPEAETLYEIGCAKISYSDPINEQIHSITDRRGYLGETIRPYRQEVCSLLLFQSYKCFFLILHSSLAEFDKVRAYRSASISKRSMTIRVSMMSQQASQVITHKSRR